MHKLVTLPLPCLGRTFIRYVKSSSHLSTAKALAGAHYHSEGIDQIRYSLSTARLLNPSIVRSIARARRKTTSHRQSGFEEVIRACFVSTFPPLTYLRTPRTLPNMSQDNASAAADFKNSSPTATDRETARTAMTKAQAFHRYARLQKVATCVQGED